MAGSSTGASNPAVPVGLSTTSVFPEPVERAFERAARLGYDGIEVMVTAERVSQDADALVALADRYGIPVLSIHSPCLLVTARVWGTDPIDKIHRSVELARALGAQTVVAHPPFVWQRHAVSSFRDAAERIGTDSGIRVAIENMFPTKVFGSVVNAYRPHWNPVPAGYRWYTLDLSHCAAAGVDAVDLARTMGSRLAHVHLADGSGDMRDEHLVPGRGIAPCAEVLRGLADAGFDGAVVLEVSTRRADEAQRERDLAESLAFARTHLG